MAFRDRFVSRYLNPLEVEAEFRDIAARFPDLCRLEELPHLTHGYEGVKVEARGKQKMYVLRITSPAGTSPKPAVLLFRSPHAREWINALAVVETARQLTENYRQADPDPRVQAIVTTLDRAEVLIVPEGNPDGARLSFFDPGQRMWRKNLRPSSVAGCAGVDCNRNYPRYFGEQGSSGEPCSEGLFRRICGWRFSDPARLWLDRRVSPPAFTFASPRYIEGEAKVKAGGKGELHTEDGLILGPRFQVRQTAASDGTESR